MQHMVLNLVGEHAPLTSLAVAMQALAHANTQPLPELLLLCADGARQCLTAWNGINCDGQTGRVSGIDLGGRALPCDTLTGGCQLLPGMFAAGPGMTALQRLNLSYTSFAADISTLDLTGQRMLKALDLRHMPNLVGTLNPAWPQLMPQLQELYLASIPAAVSVTREAHCSVAQVLDLW